MSFDDECVRVRLDVCELVDGRMFFDGVALTGVAAERGGSGSVSLWLYEDGVRVGRWSHGGHGCFLDDHADAMIVASEGLLR